jgi:hypothetical protein
VSDEDYPELGQFLGGYFHEDHGLYGDTWQEIVDYYVADFGPNSRREAVAELDRLLAANGDDLQLDQALAAVGLAYLLPDGLDARTWLTAVRDRLAASL